MPVNQERESRETGALRPSAHRGALLLTWMVSCKCERKVVRSNERYGTYQVWNRCNLPDQGGKESLRG